MTSEHYITCVRRFYGNEQKYRIVEVVRLETVMYRALHLLNSTLLWRRCSFSEPRILRVLVGSALMIPVTLMSVCVDNVVLHVFAIRRRRFRWSLLKHIQALTNHDLIVNIPSASLCAIGITPSVNTSQRLLFLCHCHHCICKHIYKEEDWLSYHTAHGMNQRSDLHEISRVRSCLNAIKVSLPRAPTNSDVDARFVSLINARCVPEHLNSTLAWLSAL